MTTTSPLQSTGRHELDSKARIYLINFDTVNGLELYTRMMTDHWASLNPDPGSQFADLGARTIIIDTKRKFGL